MDASEKLLKEKYDEIMVLYRSNNIVETNQKVQELLELSAKEHNTYYHAVCLNFLGALQTALGNPSRAIDFYFDAMIYAEKNKVGEFLPVIYNNIGARYMDAQAYDLALVYLLKSKEAASEPTPKARASLAIQRDRVIINHLNLAMSYTYLGQYEKSDVHLVEAEELMREYHNTNYAFSVHFFHCQNQYNLGNLDFVKENLSPLLDEIEKLDSLYTYSQNITDMFEFLERLDEKENTKRLIRIVQSFCDDQEEEQLKLLLCKMKVDYEKKYGTEEGVQQASMELAQLYRNKELKDLQERKDYMTLRLEMKRAELERNEAEEKLLELIQTITDQEYDCIAYLDEQMNLFQYYPSKRINDLYGHTHYKTYEEFVGGMEKLDHSSKVKEMLNLDVVRKRLKTQPSYSFILELIVNQKKYYKKYVYSYSDAAKKRLIIAINDMTDWMEEQTFQKALLKDALNDAKRANAAKSEFLSRMSHEIRTPLNAIIGYTDMTLDEMGNCDAQKDYLGKSQVAARHLLSLINDILDVSAIASGHFKIENRPFDLAQITAEVNSLFRQQAVNKKIDFSIHMDQPVHQFLVGDILRVKQILLNLLSNAIKFTDEKGSIELQIREEKIQDDEYRIVFTTIDTGIGMKKEFLDKLFVPFEQQDASISRKYGGTGLGLSISQQLVDLMNGSIEVESEENRGTKFIVNIPFLLAEDEVDIATAVKGKKILIVSDACASYLSKVADLCHVSYTIATSEKEATKECQKDIFDAIVVDECVDSSRGVYICDKIRQTYKGKMILLVDSKSNQELEDANRVGITRVEEKPLFPSNFVSALSDDTLIETKNRIEQADFSEMRVLLVEDNKVNVEIASNILKKANLIVDVAYDGEEGYKKFLHGAKGTYQAILMDIQMPVMNGYEATRAIRSSSHPDAKNIPIIALTANAFPEDIQRASEAGMNTHVAKPINVKELYQALVEQIVIKA